MLKSLRLINFVIYLYRTNEVKLNKRDMEKESTNSQCAIRNVTGSFNTLIATIMGGTIGLSIGVVGIFALNYL